MHSFLKENRVQNLLFFILSTLSLVFCKILWYNEVDACVTLQPAIIPAHLHPTHSQGTSHSSSSHKRIPLHRPIGLGGLDSGARF